MAPGVWTIWGSVQAQIDFQWHRPNQIQVKREITTYLPKPVHVVSQEQVISSWSGRNPFAANVKRRRGAWTFTCPKDSIIYMYCGCVTKLLKNVRGWWPFSINFSSSEASTILWRSTVLKNSEPHGGESPRLEMRWGVPQMGLAQ